MNDKDYDYYKFCGFVARTQEGLPFEFCENGKWVENDKRALNLDDAMHDYGDWSIGDYDKLTYEQAMELISAEE